jgi:hypothetical protein
MEREFGAEIVRTFGGRLRRIYETEDLGLTEQMVACLEQLARAETRPEAQVPIQSQPQQGTSDGQQNGYSAPFPLPTS